MKYNTSKFIEHLKLTTWMILMTFLELDWHHMIETHQMDETKPYFNGFEDRDYIHLGYEPNHMDAYEKHDEMDDIELFGHIIEIELSA